MAGSSTVLEASRNHAFSTGDLRILSMDGGFYGEIDDESPKSRIG